MYPGGKVRAISRQYRVNVRNRANRSTRVYVCVLCKIRNNGRQGVMKAAGFDIILV